jgi:putative endonuclease
VATRTESGRRAERRGRLAEALCVWVLRAKGYRILARRFSCPYGEVDIVARRGAVLAFVEVKARPDATTAREALAARQRVRLARAAEMFLAQRPSLALLSCRFDVMLVTGRRLPRHLVDAWRP